MTKATTSKTANGKAKTAPATVTGTHAKATEQLAEYAHDAINRVADAVANAEARLREASADAETSLKVKGDALKTRASSTLTRAETVAREKPLAVAGAALVTGYLLGKILSR